MKHSVAARLHRPPPCLLRSGHRQLNNEAARSCMGRNSDSHNHNRSAQAVEHSTLVRWLPHLTTTSSSRAPSQPAPTHGLPRDRNKTVRQCNPAFELSELVYAHSPIVALPPLKPETNSGGSTFGLLRVSIACLSYKLGLLYPTELSLSGSRSGHLKSVSQARAGLHSVDWGFLCHGPSPLYALTWWRRNAALDPGLEQFECLMCEGWISSRF